MPVSPRAARVVRRWARVERAGIALTAVLATVVTFLAPSAANPPAAPSSAGTAACLRDRACHRTFTVAHRAHGFGAPENSRQAVERAVAAGVPLIKIDIRATRDGELYVLHDGSLDRTTTLRGRIERQMSAQVSAARLANGETLPRLRDIYAITRGRTVLVLGFKAEFVEPVADWIAASGSFDDAVFFVNTIQAMRAAARAKQRYPQMIVMVRLLDTRVTVQTTREIFGGLPEIFHTERVGPGPVRELQRAGAKVFMNAVPWEDHLWPVRYLAIAWMLHTRLDLILTDEPLSMMRRVGDR
jgi:glycerophosphoryl diester phosphodiesterase